MQSGPILTFAGVVALLGGCIVDSDSDPNLRLPTSMAGPDTDADLRKTANVHNGCAFAGTWNYGPFVEDEGADYGPIFSYHHGNVVFEVIGDRLRGADIEMYEDAGTLSPLGGTYIPSDFIIIDAVISPGGRRASGTWEAIRNGERLSGSDSFSLSEDGLHYQQFAMGGVSGEVLAHGQKVRTGPCGVVVQYVQDAFDSVRNGKPIPKEYFE